MKILQTIAGFGVNSGGTSTCTYDLVLAMQHIGCQIDLMTLQTQDLMGKGESWIKALPNDSVSSYGYSRNINRFLQETNYDIYHTNGIWMHCNHWTCYIARKKEKPYIITPHGMLYPQALARSALKKKLMLSVYFDKDLRLADCIHVTCQQEMEHYRNLGYKNSVAVIANPVVIPDFISNLKAVRSSKKIGYLGRLHPYKRPDALIKAWAKIENEDNELILMGKGTPEYEHYLQHLINELNLKNVRFLGLISGRQKYEILASLTALCVPSKTENFGMTVAEALITQTPVICTNTAPWNDLNTYNCGWWVNNDIDTLADTIRKVFCMPQEQLTLMGYNGLELIKSKYSDIQIAKNMHQLYEWLLNGGTKPDFVYE